jgi:hypothetical protein
MCAKDSRSEQHRADDSQRPQYTICRSSSRYEPTDQADLSYDHDALPELEVRKAFPGSVQLGDRLLRTFCSYQEYIKSRQSPLLCLRNAIDQGVTMRRLEPEIGERYVGYAHELEKEIARCVESPSLSTSTNTRIADLKNERIDVSSSGDTACIGEDCRVGAPSCVDRVVVLGTRAAVVPARAKKQDRLRSAAHVDRDVCARSRIVAACGGCGADSHGREGLSGSGPFVLSASSACSARRSVDDVFRISV